MFKRGEIYYVESYYFVGSEQKAGRPAVIVSNDKNNANSSTVEVVYLTTKPKRDLPTHVTVRGTGRDSTALCEQITSVSIERVGEYCGECSNQELSAIETALMISLGLNMNNSTEKINESTNEKSGKLSKEVVEADELLMLRKKLTSTNAQLDILQKMYKDLLLKVMK